jgi:hypothetical protein
VYFSREKQLARFYLDKEEAKSAKYTTKGLYNMSFSNHNLATLKTTRELAADVKSLAADIHLKTPEIQELALLLLLVLTGRIRAEGDIDRYLPAGNSAAVACRHILREGNLWKQPVFTDALRTNERSLSKLNETTRDSLPESVVAALEAIVQASQELQEVIDFDSTFEGVRRIIQAAERLQQAIEAA